MEFIEKLYTGESISPLKLYCAGRRLSAPNHRFGPADRAHFWLIYLREGCGTFTMCGLTHRIGAGDLFVAYPDQRILYRADPDSVWSIYWVSLDEHGILPYLSMLGITKETPVCHAKAPLSAERILESLLDEVPRTTPAAAFVCAGLLYRLFSCFAPGEGDIGAERDYIDEAIFFLSSHSDEEITVADCADVVGLNPSYLSRLFRRRTGVTPCAWLNAYRLDRAAVLLRETDMTVSEIARAVGIGDPLYFSRCFSKKFGTAPREYRRIVGQTASADEQL